MDKIELLKVESLPKELESGILYYSQEFGIAGHLCPCGCGNKIITPIEPTEWSITTTKGKPTLSPSLGNWELPCKSHYWIKKGKIEWSYQWTDKQIKIGREAEEEKRKNYYNKSNRKQKEKPIVKRILAWFLRSDSKYLK